MEKLAPIKKSGSIVIDNADGMIAVMLGSGTAETQRRNRHWKIKTGLRIWGINRRASQ